MKIYTAKELADALHISEETLYRLRRSGRIGFLKISGRGSGGVRFTEQHVAEFIASSEQAAQRKAAEGRPKPISAEHVGRTMARIAGLDDAIKRAHAVGDAVKAGMLMAQRADLRALLRKSRRRR
jgi:excisionase family DNA binding protein